MNSTIKQKPRKPKKCLCPCGEMFVPKGMEKWISQSHYARWLTETEKGQEVMAKKIEKAKKQVAKVEKEADNKIREKLKTLGKFESEAKTEFQRYIRKRDAELPCISCGTMTTDLWDGGHFKKAELYS